MNFSWPSIRRQIALFSAMAGILSGCQTNKADSFMASSLADDISVAAAEGIANDLVAHLAQQVGPGTGTVLLRQDGSVFGKAFDTALKNRGYAVVTNQKWDAKERVIPIAYVVIPFEGQLRPVEKRQSGTRSRLYDYSIRRTTCKPAFHHASGIRLFRHGPIAATWWKSRAKKTAAQIRRVNRLPLFIGIGVVFALVAIIYLGLMSRGVLFPHDEGPAIRQETRHPILPNR